MAKKSTNTTTVQITEVTITTGRTKSVRFMIDGKEVQVPVDEAVYAYFNEQFCRPNPTALQRKRFATLMNVVRAAYEKGLKDGGGS